MLCIKCGTEKESQKRCKICLAIYHKQYSKENKDKLNKHSLDYYYNNPEKIKQYKKENKTKITQYHNDYEQQRKLIDPVFKIRKNCSRLIGLALLASSGSKNGQSILKHLSYTMKELKDHLEKQFDSKMSWDNYGRYWHIDHIYPQSLLPYTNMEEENFKKCWALSNLQPLEAIANIKKSNKLEGII